MYSIIVRSRTALAASSAKENTPALSMKENATGKKKSTLNKSGGPRRPTSAWPVQQLRRFSDKLRLVGVTRTRIASEHKTIYESPSNASTIKDILSATPASPMLSASTSGASMLLDTLGSLLDMHDADVYPETQDDGTLAAGTSCDLLADFLSVPERLAPPATPRLPSTPRFAEFMPFAPQVPHAGSFPHDRTLLTPPPTPRLPSTSRFPSTPRFEDSMLLAPPSPFAGNDLLSRLEFVAHDGMRFSQPSRAPAGSSALPTPPPTPRFAI